MSKRALHVGTTPGRALCLALVLGATAAGYADPVRGGDLADLADRGITSSLTYDGAALINLAGGLQRRSDYGDVLQLELNLDLKRLFGWPGTLFYVNGLRIHGGQPGDLVGDAQGVSSIAASPRVQIEEAWLQKNFPDERSSLLAGLYDLNREFYRLQSAELFLNSSFGIGPEFSQSGAAGPSVFPDTSAAIRFAYKPRSNVVLRLALLNGVPQTGPDRMAPGGGGGDGALLVAEAALLSRPNEGTAPVPSRRRLGRFSALPPYEDKLAFGVWHYTATYADLRGLDSSGQPLNHRGSSGGYAIADATLSRDDDDPGRVTTAFVQLGVGDSRVDRFGAYAGAGLVRTGPFRRRPRDQAGLAVAMARNGSHYLEQQQDAGLALRRTEVSFEITYLTQVLPWLTLQPDLQFVVRPNTDPRVGNSLAFTLRFELDLTPH